MSGADMVAGIRRRFIRIIAEKRRENGNDGSAAFNTRQGSCPPLPPEEHQHPFSCLDFYAVPGGKLWKDKTTTDEQTSLQRCGQRR